MREGPLSIHKMYTRTAHVSKKTEDDPHASVLPTASLLGVACGLYKPAINDRIEEYVTTPRGEDDSLEDQMSFATEMLGLCGRLQKQRLDTFRANDTPPPWTKKTEDDPDCKTTTKEDNFLPAGLEDAVVSTVKDLNALQNFVNELAPLIQDAEDLQTQKGVQGAINVYEARLLKSDAVAQLCSSSKPWQLWCFARVAVNDCDRRALESLRDEENFCTDRLLEQIAQQQPNFILLLAEAKGHLDKLAAELSECHPSSWVASDLIYLRDYYSNLLSEHEKQDQWEAKAVGDV